MNDYSTSSLLTFLEYAERKGLMNKRTAQSKKNSVGSIVEILDEHEKIDVRELDVDQVLERFANIQGPNFTPVSLTSYKSRLASSIREFVRYKDNPLTYSSKKNKKLKRPKASSTSLSRASNSVPSQSKINALQPADTVLSQHVFPIPLRNNCVVKIAGLPFDLTEAEAKKIGAVVSALALQ